MVVSWMRVATSGREGSADAHTGPSTQVALAHLLAATPDLLVVVGSDGRVLHLNPAAAEHVNRLGVDHELHIEHVIAPVSRPAFEGALDHLERSSRWAGELLLRATDGALPASVVITATKDEHETITTLTLLARDVSGYKSLEADLAHRATHDLLTGLANRASFLERLRVALADGGGRRAGNVAVLFVDIDRFKHVNDSLGHETGDDLLVEVARRLSDAVRPGDLVARLGGDEFVVLCEGVSDEPTALAIAERLRKVCERPYRLDGRAELSVTMSVGVSVGHDVTPDLLLQHADAAMYQAKERGRARCALFDEQLRIRAASRLALERDLRLAIERDELRLVYQPEMSLTSGRLVGIEALLRWHHHAHGLVMPVDFIPVAEDSGLIVPIGAWVLEEACRQTKRWTDQFGPESLTIHVNLSPRQFTQPDLAQVITGALDRSGLPAGQLCVEITETAVMDAIEHAASTLERLRALGVLVAVDDFGTGHSSLSYLKRLPVDVLKLDRSFIDRLGEDPTDSAIVVAVVNLARSLGLTVVAEGVETETQRRELRALGCTLAQGYYFSRPLPASELEALLADG